MTVRAEADPTNRRELLQALVMWTRGVREESGAHGAELYEDAERPAVFLVTTHWRDRAALDTHVMGAGFAAASGALELLASCSQVWLADVAVETPGLSDLRRRRTSLLGTGTRTRDET